MESHTLILKRPRIEITPGIVNIAFIESLINNKSVEIDYFGLELDNQADFVDDEMQTKIDNTTFIDINFDTEEAIDYEALSEPEVFELVLGVLANSKNREITADDKDFSLYV